MLLGFALYGQGKPDLAVAELREAIRLKPDLAQAHSNLGSFLCNAKRDYPAAEAAHREAIRLQPDLVEAHTNLAVALIGQAKLDEAVAEYRTAIRLKPDDVSLHVTLGAFLCDVKQDYPAAEAEIREAIRNKPDDDHAHYCLGNALTAQGNSDLAAAEFREAIRLNPKHAEAHCNLGQVLRAKGDFAGALEMFRKGHELGSRRRGWSYPSAQWLASALHMVALSNRLPAVLRGEDKPGDHTECLYFAEMASARKNYFAAARLWAEALAADPRRAEDRDVRHRYPAACAAALAAAGQSKNDPPPDDAARARLRAQALEWLKAELAARTKLIDSGVTQARPAILLMLGQWKRDTDLAGIRDGTELAKLPEAERKEWQALWADVEAMLERAAARNTIDMKPDGAGKVKRPDDRAEPKPSVAHQEPPVRANLKPGVEQGSSDAFAAIHKRAHELAPTKPGEAEPLFRQALEGYRKTQGPDGALTLDLTNDLAGLLSQSGGHTEAEQLFSTALAQARKLFGPDHPHTAGIMAQFGLSLTQQSKWSEAEPLLRDCLAIREKSQPDVWNTFNIRSLLGASLLGQKKYALAEPLILSGYEGMRAREAKIPPQGKPRLTDAADRVVELYESWGKQEKAAQWRAKLAKPVDESKPES